LRKNILLRSSKKNRQFRIRFTNVSALLCHFNDVTGHGDNGTHTNRSSLEIGRSSCFKVINEYNEQALYITLYKARLLKKIL